MTKPAKVNNAQSDSLSGLEAFFSAVVDLTAESSVDEGWTLAQASHTLGVTERTVRRWIKEQRFRAWKVEGPRGPEWRIHPGSSVDSKTGDAGSTVVRAADGQTLLTLATLVKEQAEKLEAASFRNGYLEHQLQNYEQQVKLLPDFQAQAAKAQEHEDRVKVLTEEVSKLKSSWWYRFSRWFAGSNDS